MFFSLVDTLDLMGSLYRKTSAVSAYFYKSKNVKYEPSFESNKIIWPPLHINFGLVKKAVRGLKKECSDQTKVFQA